uniref:Uncharacterized protein n=1 Tax=Desertifilum tharense IPPAS B-1220 TaxID=1781255 RepID=A0ACD5GWS4_9CYAN
MRDPLFIEPPRVELLQGLARGSLKQNLPRAIRLWVWLRFLYGEEGLQTAFPDEFSFADWRTTFFTDTHPANEGIPPNTIAIVAVPRQRQNGYLPPKLAFLRQNGVKPSSSRTRYPTILKIFCKRGYLE